MALDMGEVISALGLDPTVARTFRDRPDAFRPFITRMVAAYGRVFPEAQLLDAAEGSTAQMAKVNSALAAVKGASAEEIASGLSELADMPNPHMRRLLEMQDRLEGLEADLEAAKRTEAYSLRAAKEEQKLAVHALATACFGGSCRSDEPVLSTVEVQSCKGVVFATKDGLHFVRTDSVVVDVSWPKGYPLDIWCAVSHYAHHLEDIDGKPISPSLLINIGMFTPAPMFGARVSRHVVGAIDDVTLRSDDPTGKYDADGFLDMVRSNKIRPKIMIGDRLACCSVFGQQRSDRIRKHPPIPTFTVSSTSPVTAMCGPLEVIGLSVNTDNAGRGLYTREQLTALRQSHKPRAK